MEIKDNTMIRHNAATKIVLESRSGYCPVEFVYTDKLTIDSKSVSYSIHRGYSSKSAVKWSYRTDNSDFKELFRKISREAEHILEIKEINEIYDIGELKITVKYADESKKSETYTNLGNQKEKLFALIEKMIPEFEDKPEMMKKVF